MRSGECVCVRTHTHACVCACVQACVRACHIWPQCALSRAAYTPRYLAMCSHKDTRLVLLHRSHRHTSCALASLRMHAHTRSLVLSCSLSLCPSVRVPVPVSVSASAPTSAPDSISLARSLTLSDLRGAPGHIAPSSLPTRCCASCLVFSNEA